MSLEKNILPHKKIGIAVIVNEENQILIDRRLPTGLMANLWEFPGGKIEAGETARECIKREIKEELGVTIEVKEHFLTLDHTYSEFQVTLMVYLCLILEGEPQPLECSEVRWVKVSELDNFSFPEANQDIIRALTQKFNY